MPRYITYAMLKAIAEEILEMELEYEHDEVIDFPIKLLPERYNHAFEVSVKAISKETKT